jgi:hypothetical protein
MDDDGKMDFFGNSFLHHGKRPWHSQEIAGFILDAIFCRPGPMHHWIEFLRRFLKAIQTTWVNEYCVEIGIAILNRRFI